MHARKRIASLTETLGIRVTEEERQTLEQRAEETHLSLSEWCRQALLGCIETSPDTRLILSELLGLRRMFLALQVEAVHGHAVTPERLRAVMDEAERTKFEMADKRISALRDRAKKLPQTPSTGEAIQ